MKSVFLYVSAIILACFITWGLTPNRGEINCWADGSMTIHIQTSNIDTHALKDALFYLCDQDTIGFGYNNPKVFRH